MDRREVVDRDDGVRDSSAVGISLAERANGLLRLVLDDLELASDSPSQWNDWTYFTSIDVSEEKAAAHDLTQED